MDFTNVGSDLRKMSVQFPHFRPKKKNSTLPSITQLLSEMETESLIPSSRADPQHQWLSKRHQHYLEFVKDEHSQTIPDAVNQEFLEGWYLVL